MRFYDMISVLKELSKNNIEYVVLRGFIPTEEINKSKDVDVYIPLKYKKKVSEMFKKLGWYSQKLKCSRYPHEQYIYIMNDGVKKFDIVYGLYYGEKLYEYKLSDIVSDYRIIDDIYIPSEVNTLKTFILHILFDKKQLSEKNKKYFDLIYEDYSNKKQRLDNVFLEIADIFYNSKIDDINKNIKEYRTKVLQSNILSFNIARTFYYFTKKKFNNLLRNFLIRIPNKMVSIIGVDGSGKSTTINCLNKILYPYTNIQYMGFKNYETKIAIKHFRKKTGDNGILFKINELIVQYFDLLYRFIKNRFKSKVVILDRFPWEAAINYHGLQKIVTFIQYKILFPRPRIVYYLYCDVSTSIERKDDIKDIESFKNMKKKFDKEYLNNKKIRSFSTNTMESEKIVQEIIKDLNCKMLKYFC